MEEAEQSFIHATYASYREASLRSSSSSSQTLPSSATKPISLYSLPQIYRLLTSLLLILIHGFSHFLLAAILLLFMLTPSSLTPPMLLMGILYILFRYPRQVKSKPGLYFADNDDNHSIISHCQVLSSFQKKSSLAKPQLPRFTPYILTGDLATLLPYLCNRPPAHPYRRRWVRVPLDQHPTEQTPLSTLHNDSKYESVAVDYVMAKEASSSSNKCLLILAGLSGGSNEGYCRDLVDAALRKNFHCFVMLGRGLAGEPVLSNALFHGARTSDAATVARIMKKCFGPSSYLCAVGISLGGMIIVNCLGRNSFATDIDAAVSISGGFDNDANISNTRSRHIWQPILVHGLKQVLVSHPISCARFRAVYGDDAENLLQSLKDVIEYDEKVVAVMNGFRDLRHLYEESNPPAEKLYEYPVRPLLSIHAIDDPIIHVDTIPSYALCSSLSSSQKYSANLFTLLTATGGHVGWPLGWCFWRRRWEFQNTITFEFLDAVLTQKMLNRPSCSSSQLIEE